MKAVNTAIANIAKNAILSSETLYVSRQGVRTADRTNCVKVVPTRKGEYVSVLLQEFSNGIIVRQATLAPNKGQWYVVQ